MAILLPKSQKSLRTKLSSYTSRVCYCPRKRVVPPTHSGNSKGFWAHSVPAANKKAAPIEEQMSQVPQNVISRPSVTSNAKGDTGGLIRGLGVWSATAAVVGLVIGTAIFLVG